MQDKVEKNKSSVLDVSSLPSINNNTNFNLNPNTNIGSTVS